MRTVFHRRLSGWLSITAHTLLSVAAGNHMEYSPWYTLQPLHSCHSCHSCLFCHSDHSSHSNLPFNGTDTAATTVDCRVVAEELAEELCRKYKRPETTPEEHSRSRDGGEETKVASASACHSNCPFPSGDKELLYANEFGDLALRLRFPDGMWQVSE